VQAAEATVSQGEQSLRFNHRARVEFERLGRISEAQRAFEHAVTRTRGVVRSMLDLDAHLRDPGLAPVLGALADLLRDLHVQVVAFGRLLAAILVDGERLMRELDVRDGAHLGGVARA
jgi:hypothetical protein